MSDLYYFISDIVTDFIPHVLWIVLFIVFLVGITVRYIKSF